MNTAIEKEKCSLKRACLYTLLESARLKNTSTLGLKSKEQLGFYTVKVLKNCLDFAYKNLKGTS